ncbi:MFS transporter [Klebsiella pneumoniae]|uniref:MFS transporter n=1 Tax=Klebsiella pneumoniae TaxID=573 RepID=A0A3P2EHZ9_KLEPN|nr:MFS transporter [Klebsiella pneumoniae]
MSIAPYWGSPPQSSPLSFDRPGDHGNPLLRLRLDLCSGADPRRIVSRPLWQQSDLLLSLTLWSLFTLFHGMAVGLKTLLLCRFGLGISEAPCFPVNSRVVSAWFPQQERAKATAVYTVGSISGWPALRRCCSGSWTVSAGGCCSSALAPSAFCLPGVVALLPRTA